MKHLVPCLAILATAISVPAIDISGDNLKVSLSGFVQTQIIAGAEGTNLDGSDADVLRTDASGNAKSGSPESARFNIRRARLTADANYGDGWRGLITLIGNENKELSGTNNNQAVTVFYAYGAKTFKGDGLSHTIKLGLDKTFTSESGLSSGAYAVPFERPAATLVTRRIAGAAYRLTGDSFVLGVDAGNNSSTSGVVTSTGGKNGMLFAARVEIAPSKAMKPSKRQESYVGEAGTHVLLGVEYGYDGNQVQADNTKKTQEYVGPDLLVHLDALTAVADYKLLREAKSHAASPSHKNGSVWDVRLAYAFPLGGPVIEPSLGYAVVDINDNDNAEASKTGLIVDGTNTRSGTTLDVGVNLYFSKHSNKLQLGYRDWTGEKDSAGKEASERGVVLQHQILF